MSKVRLSISTMAAGAALVLSASSAHATGEFGSAVRFTARDCAGLAPTANCGVGTPRIYNQFAGGAGQAVSYYDNTSAGDFVSSMISFGVDALPTIRQSDGAVSDYRVNVNAFAYNAFTNTGSTAVELSYAGDLHIVNSSGSPLGGNPESAGGAGYFAYVAIWDPSVVAGLQSAQDLQSVTGSQCGDAGVLGYGEVGGAGFSGALTGGEQRFHIATTSCSGSPILIAAGQEVLAVEFFQTPVNRGGFVDASHTFIMSYDPGLGDTAIQALQYSMAPAAPEGLAQCWSRRPGGCWSVASGWPVRPCAAVEG